MMKPAYSVSLISLCIILSMTSCVVYSPSVTPMLQVEKKGEIQVDGGVGILTPSISASIGAGLTDHLAIQASYTGASEGMRHFEGNIGYYNFSENDLGFALLLGYRMGYTTVMISKNYPFYSNRRFDIKGSYKMPFVKIQMIKKFNGPALGLGLKLGNAHHALKIREGHVDKKNWNWDINENVFLIEPSVMLSSNAGRRFKASLNIAATFTNAAKFNQDIYKNLNLGIGLTYIFGREY